MTTSSSEHSGRAAGVAGALLVVVLVYTPAGFGAIERLWAVGLALLLGFVLGEAVTSFPAQLWVPGAVPAGLMAVLSAIYLCVPETDQVPVVALLPAALFLAEVVSRESVGTEWYGIAIAGVAWAGLFGSAGRQSALVGALFAWWPIVLPWLIERLRGIGTVASTLLTMLIGVAAAALFARTGGIHKSGVSAGFIVIPVACVSTAAAWLASARLAPRSAVAAE